MWKFYTNITLNNVINNDPLNQAFLSFVNKFILKQEDVLKEIKNNGSVNFDIIINDENDKNDKGESDIIKIDGVNHIFYKSKFLRNRKFKKYLIDYYNNINIFVQGPIEFDRNKFLITLTKFEENKDLKNK